MNQLHVAIVMVSWNASSHVVTTLSSLAQAKREVRASLFLIDNGSARTDADIIAAEVENFQRESGVRVTFWDLRKNLGFAGGNNVGITAALKDPSVTHICLLNPDVVVSDHWLDRLLDYGLDAISCVTNAAGNEQAIPARYSQKSPKGSFATINEFAQSRYDRWRGNLTTSDFISFFLVLLTRELVSDVGLLDERFYPGYLEDDDYCQRIKARGYSLSIARDVYVHHVGSASFATLPARERLTIGHENRRRFEEKYNRPWSDRSNRLLHGLWLEITFVLNRYVPGDEYRRDLSAYVDRLEDQLRGRFQYHPWSESADGLGDVIHFLRHDASGLASAVKAKTLLTALWCKLRGWLRRRRQSLSIFVRDLLNRA